MYVGEEFVLIVGGMSTTSHGLTDIYSLNTTTWRLKKVIHLILLSCNAGIDVQVILHSMYICTFQYKRCQSLLCSQIFVNMFLQLCLSLPEGRCSHSTVVWQKGIIIAGGMNPSLQPLSSCLYLSHMSCGWNLSYFNISPLLPPKSVYINI